MPSWRKINESTVEGQSPRGCVLPHLVLSQALVPPCVVLLEAGDLQHSFRVLHFDFAGEGDAVGPLPRDLRDRAGRRRERVNLKKLKDCDPSCF